MAIVKLSDLEGDFVTVRDAAKVVPCTEQTIRNQIAKGALSSVKQGGSRRIPREALADYLGYPKDSPVRKSK